MEYNNRFSKDLIYILLIGVTIGLVTDKIANGIGGGIALGVALSMISNHQKEEIITNLTNLNNGENYPLEIRMRIFP
jgi:hypothetical protein